MASSNLGRIRTLVVAAVTVAVCTVAGPHLAGSLGLSGAVGSCSPVGGCCPVGGQSPVDGCVTQTIVFTSHKPNPADQYGEYDPTAVGGGSGNPVVITVDATSSSVCEVSYPALPVIYFTEPGTCVLDANQAGSATYSPAVQVQQSIEVVPQKQHQYLSFGTYPPSVEVGQSAPVDASGGASGNPVTLTVSATSAAVCSLQPVGPPVGATTDDLATFTGAGTCTITAKQSGDADYISARPVRVSIQVRAPQAITFDSVPSDPEVGGPTYTVSATGGASGEPVVFSAKTPGVCTVSGSIVTFVTPGKCTVHANQAGDALYLAAPTAVQSFHVAPALAFTSPTGLDTTIATPTSFHVATNTSVPVTYSSHGNGDGLLLGAVTGVLDGTPTAAGTFHLTITATNGIGPAAVQSFGIVVHPFHVTTTALPGGTPGVGYKVQLHSLGGTTPLTWTALNPLPSGLHLTSGGRLAGIPATTLSAGSYPVRVRATDSAQPAHTTPTADLTLELG